MLDGQLSTTVLGNTLRDISTGMQGSHWHLDTESGGFLLSLNGTSCMKATHGSQTQYVVSSAAVCQAAQKDPVAPSSSLLQDSSTEASIAPSESKNVSCDESASFQVLVSADSACIALIMHGGGVHGVPEHLRSLVLAAQRCGLTQDDVIAAMPALLDNTTATEMCGHILHVPSIAVPNMTEGRRRI